MTPECEYCANKASSTSSHRSAQSCLKMSDVSVTGLMIYVYKLRVNVLYSKPEMSVGFILLLT